MDRVEFGYWPRAEKLIAGDINIRPLDPGSDRELDDFDRDHVSGDWIYAPLNRTRQMFSGEIITQPYSRRVFPLPKTHELSHKHSEGQEHLKYLVWCLGFFVGMRLTTTEAGFLDGTPIRERKLVDFVVGGKNGLADCLQLSERFWQYHKIKPSITGVMPAIINAYFMCQLPILLQFEQFIYAYTALDGCFALWKQITTSPPRGRLPHSHRIKVICEEYGMDLPDWAAPNSKNHTKISELRNAAMHEAIYYEEPLGFAVFSLNNSSRNLTLEMTSLVSRFIIALLGRHDVSYVHSPVSAREMHGLKLA
ncbi:MAG TPA: hypothetical protein VIQ53_17455 [Inquilinus sp.]